MAKNIPTVEDLQSINIFSSLNDKELNLIKKFSSKISYTKNTIICLSGDPATFFAGIINGKIKVSSFSESGREIAFYYLYAGDCFGEMSIFDKEPYRSATLTSVVKSEIIVINNLDFARLVKEIPSLFAKLGGILSDRLRQSNKKVESMCFLTLKQKVADFLLECCEKSDNYICSQREIVESTGANRESISRVISEMRQNGIIKKESKKDNFKIDLEKLKAYSETNK